MDEDIRAEFERLWGAIHAIESKLTANSGVIATVAKQQSIKEFLLVKKPKDDVQRTLLIGYYLEKYRHIPSFNVRDLEEGLREAKEPIPGNINDKVNINIKSGCLMEAAEKKDKLKAWTLTVTGEQLVERDLKKGG